MFFGIFNYLKMSVPRREWLDRHNN